MERLNGILTERAYEYLSITQVQEVNEKPNFCNISLDHLFETYGNDVVGFPEKLLLSFFKNLTKALPEKELKDEKEEVELCCSDSDNEVSLLIEKDSSI